MNRFNLNLFFDSVLRLVLSICKVRLLGYKNLILELNFDNTHDIQLWDSKVLI